MSLADLIPEAFWPQGQALLAALPTLALALALLAGLLVLGTALGQWLGTHQWGIPEALLAGGLGLLLAPDGPLPLFPPAVLPLWDELPLILLTMVFASLLLGKPLPSIGGLKRPLLAQVLLALSLAFGQYLVAALAVWLVLQPLLGVPSVMACLIEVAYEGGHGSAAAMGPTYARLGLESGAALGLALATVGLLASTLVGGLLVLLGRRRGWVAREKKPQKAPSAVSPLPVSSLPHPPERQAPAAKALTPAVIAVNLMLTGTAVLIGWLMLEALRLVAARSGGLIAMVIDALPVFPLALVGSLLVRLLLERSGREALVAPKLQSRIGTLSADLLITAATACLDLSLLARDWLPLTVLAGVGLIWNLAVILLLAPRLLPASWFERALVEFGQATGVAASGLLLLNMVDPDDDNGSLTPFSIKQLILQPFLAGGVITVVSPLAVTGWGLPLWSGFCLALVSLFILTGLWLGRSRDLA